MLQVLRNPAYAGAYVHGRHVTRKTVDAAGNVRTVTGEVPRAQWKVLIKDHHPGYVTWDEYLAIETLEDMHKAVPVLLPFNLAINPDGLGECAFGAMLCFDEALKLVRVGFFHRETFLVCVQCVRSNKRHKR